MKQMTSYQVQVAGEAFAAGALAHAGCNVSIQYAANQPEYDLLAETRDRVLKVQVKGSQDGAWGLTQSLMEKRDYHGAADKWLAKQGKKTVYVLVQFEGVTPGQSPRLYLATPREIADRLKQSSKGRGETILFEYREWSKRAHGYGTIDRIPKEWTFTKQRVDEFIRKYAV
jgi:Holliday junction resolvase-like predicted endonuclease